MFSRHLAMTERRGGTSIVAGALSRNRNGAIRRCAISAQRVRKSEVASRRDARDLRHAPFGKNIAGSLRVSVGAIAMMRAHQHGSY
jgi:hypothetical protein